VTCLLDDRFAGGVRFRCQFGLVNLKIKMLEALATYEFGFADSHAHRSASSRMLFVFIISNPQASVRRGSPVNSDSRNFKYRMPMRRLRSPAVKSSHTRFSVW
jgi:hypothetical protein